MPCPNCQQTITVPAPAAPVAPRLATVAPPPARPPVSGTRPSPTARAPVRTSGLAIASLICSCAGLIFGFLGTIPGIICGLKASSQIKRNPGLGGKGLATAGLITGCVLSLLWIPLTYIFVVATISGFRAVAVQQKAQAETKRIEDQFKGPAGADLDTKPDGSGWTLDLDGVSIPDTPVSGRMQGRQFKAKEIELAPSFRDFEFRYDNNDRIVSANSEEFITLGLRFDKKDVELYSGRTFVVRKDDTVSIQPQGIWTLQKPRLRMVWKFPGEKPSDTVAADIKYAMRLEFGELKNGKLPGRIYLCVLDQKKSFMRGKFVANVKPDPFAASRSQRSRGFTRPGENLPLDIAPDAAGWTIELAGVSIPDAPATGRVHGVAFKVEQAPMQVGGVALLQLRQGDDFFADRKFGVMLWESDPAKLSGQTIQWPSSDPNRRKPMIDVEWKESGQPLPNRGNVEDFVMRLEFGELKGDQLPGRIYLCVLDREKSFVRGSFVVTVQRATNSPAQMPQTLRRLAPPFPRGGQRP